MACKNDCSIELLFCVCFCFVSVLFVGVLGAFTAHGE